MGYLRLASVLAIMILHLVGIGQIPASLSVLFFYALSGYLATLLMGRWLRLWPVYLIIFVMTLVGFAVGLVPSIGGETDAIGLLKQLLMFAPVPAIYAVIPPAWMLKYILLAYLLAAATVLTRRYMALALLALSMMATSRLVILGDPLWHYYPSAELALQCISLGAVAYHMGLVLPRDGRGAAWAGALSYPVFLSHWLVGDVLVSLSGAAKGWPLFGVSLGPTLCTSWLLVLWVEQPIARYRKSLAQ
jgi:peptidoglycan/LPS O-acetylase OafA/YrhL